MKISYNWLRHYLELDPAAHGPDALAAILPLIGFDIEACEKLGPPPLENVVVGEVLQYDRHPNADRLRVCQVVTAAGEAPRNIVCGASNFEAGDRVVVALPGAVLPGNFKIKKSKLRGEVSEGMLCSRKELNLGEDHSGILVLDREAPLGTPLNELFAGGDTVFDLEVTPNRVDALCHLGIARELAAKLGKPVHYPEVRAGFENPLEAGEAPLLEAVEVSAEAHCPHYTATCIRSVKVGPSPDWLREAIEAIGLRPVNNVVDVTNYVLHETCQPLHAFDAAKIRGRRLVVRMADPGEQITTLDEKTRELDASTAVIADAERPLVIAGVMGSLDAEVDTSTTDLVLEAAYFNPASIRATSRRLGVSSDSAYRFERGVDPQGVVYAALRAIDLILEVAGGRLAGNTVVAGQLPPTASEIELRPDEVRRAIGFEVADDTIAAVLESLELEVARHDEADGSQRWDVGIPSFRGDLQRPVDLIEEFVRVYGTERIPESEVVARGIRENDHRSHTFNQQAAAYLAGRGLDEAFAYSLRDGEEVEALFGAETAACLRLANPLQSDQSHLRPSLVPGLVDVLKLNLSRVTGASRFFERGRVFREIRGDLTELVSVGFVILADRVKREWRQRQLADFYTARTLCSDLLDLAGISAAKLEFQPIEACRLWQPGHAAVAGDLEKAGYACTAGLLNVGTVNDRWDFTHPIIAGSVLLTPALLKRNVKHARHGEISNQPAASKDIALLVDRSVLAGRLEAEIATFAKEATEDFDCESVRTFDVYEGDGLPEGKKSLAITMTFRAPDRTLKDKEVNAVFDRIQQLIAEETDYAIRK